MQQPYEHLAFRVQEQRAALLEERRRDARADQARAGARARQPAQWSRLGQTTVAMGTTALASIADAEWWAGRARRWRTWLAGGQPAAGR